MRRSIAALCLVAVALSPACSRNKAPNSLFDAAGYHVRGDKVYYLSAFPGKASEIAGADVASFKAFDTTISSSSTGCASLRIRLANIWVHDQPAVVVTPPSSVGDQS